MSALERLGLVVLYDQLSRHMFRNTAAAFATDAAALAIANQLLTTGALEELTPEQQRFALMPLEHSESLADKDTLIRYAEEQLDGAEGSTAKLWRAAIEQARKHRAVLEGFGRYPKRNDALGRSSTVEEKEYIASRRNRHY